jgi:hypothetical protein
MARWVNEQPTLPLDLRELDTNTGERDGALIEAAAAYSLRKLKEDFTADVVEVRRNVDGETEGFTADEVTDGTLESFVNASFDDELPLDQATGAAAAYSLRNLKAAGTDVTATESFSFTGADGDSATYNGVLFTVDGISNGKPQYYTADRSANISWATAGYWTLFATVTVARSSNSTDDYPWQATWGGQGVGDDDDLNNATFNTNTGKYVVQTRRSSDDAVKSFTASEVADGTLEDWVDTDVTLYTQSGNLNIPAGSGTFVTLPSYTVKNTIGHTFRISFKLKRNTGGLGTSGAVSVRTTSTWNYTTLEKSSNLTELNNRFEINTSTEEYQTYSFACSTNEGSNEGFLRFQTYDSNDSYTVKDFTLEVIEANGHVRTWYDQSGSDNHAVQTTPANQPKIVEGGSLVTGGIDFDGTDDFFDLDLGADLAQPNSFFMVQTSDTTNSAFNEFFDTTSGTPRTLLDQNAGYRLTAGVNLEDASFTAETNRVLFSAFANSTSSFICKNGASSAVGDAGTEGVNQFSSIARSFDRYYDGKMDEFIIYNSDQSDNRTAIEANIGETYGITAIPAADDTVNGFVQTWYDQSGNGNDAEQTTAANQPKIVINGVRAVGGMRFDDNQFLETADTFTYGSGTTLSTFLVNNSDGDESAYLFRFVSDYIVYNTGGGGRRVFAGNNANAGNVTGDEELWTTISELNTAGGTSNFYVDGTLASPADAPIGTRTVSNRVLNIGGSGTTTHWNGTANEVIFYATDQSSNRTDIETNIINHYDI